MISDVGKARIRQRWLQRRAIRAYKFQEKAYRFWKNVICRRTTAIYRKLYDLNNKIVKMEG